MHDIAYPLAAIRDDGRTIIAWTPAEASAFRNLRVGPKHAEPHTGQDGDLRFTTHEWILRDEDGHAVVPWDLPGAPVRRPWYARRLALTQAAAERRLPIPGTGSRRRYSSGFRGFDANLSMRAAEAGLESDLDDWGLAGVNVGRRRARSLPQVWDDVAYRHGRRSWKHTRATQWRG